MRCRENALSPDDTVQWHCSDVIMSTMTSQITDLRLFAQSFVQVQIKENIKAPRHWTLWGEPPVTGGFPSQRPVHGKFFHLMTSSWIKHTNPLKTMRKPHQGHSSQNMCIFINNYGHIYMYIYIYNVDESCVVIGVIYKQEAFQIIMISLKIKAELEKTYFSFLPSHPTIRGINSTSFEG